MDKLTLFFDTETSDMIKFKAPDSDPSQPWIVQLAAILCEGDKEVSKVSLILESAGLPMSPEAQAVHGISAEMADKFGVTQYAGMHIFYNLVRQADVLVAHNYNFDIRLIAITMKRIAKFIDNPDHVLKSLDEIKAKPMLCTMLSTTKYCNLPGTRGPKWPKLEELHRILFEKEMEDAHDAMADVIATKACYYELKRREVI